jgi:VTC domain-containing protein
VVGGNNTSIGRGDAAAELMRHVDGFDPISLPELESRAALQMRVDRKYIVDYETLERLLSHLGEDYLALEIDGERLQQYDSVYFDTPELMGYRHHLQGRRKRFKCRTRLYGGTACFFDLKMKGKRGETVKRRLPLSPPAHGSVTSDARAFLKRELLQEYGVAAPAELLPTLHNSFARLALTHARQPERLTIDFGLVLAAVEGSERYRMRPGHVLIEAKSATGLGTVDRILPGLGARPLTMCSKYCLGLALARPGLPTNPYKPLLRRHFDPTPLPPRSTPLPALLAGVDMPVAVNA